MTTVIIIVLAIIGAGGTGAAILFGTEFGERIRDKITGRDKAGLTDLSEADTLSTAKDVGAVAPGVARDPFSVVLGYYIDSKNAQRVRRDPESYGQLVSTEPGLPTLVFGPPGSGKTTSLLQPAILTFGQGKSPILAGSVKHDLAHATIKLRAKLGTAQIFDPTGQTPSNLKPYVAKWTPLAACRTWRGANETAAALVFASTEGGDNDKFWSSQSVSLMSVLLFIVASRPGSSMQQVSELLGDLLTSTSGAETEEDGGTEQARGFEYVQAQITDAIATRERQLDVIKAQSANGSLPVAEAASQISKLEFRIDEFRAAQETVLPFIAIAKAAPPTIGGVLAGCTNVLQVYRYAREYARVTWDDEDLIDIDAFLNGSNTVYLCAPPRNLELYAPLLSAFASAVIARAYEIGQSRVDGRLPHGLLLAIDEYAAMPINDLPALFATARSYGLTFLVAAQDLSQIVHKNGEALARSLLSSAACIAVLSRAKDPYTIDTLSKIAGESKVQSLSYTQSTSKSKAKGGEDKGKQEGTSESVTESHEFRPLLPPGKISTFDKQEAFAIVGNQRCQILLRPHYKTEILSRLAEGDVSALQEENTFHNVKADIPAQPTESLADFSDPVEPDPYEEKRRSRRQSQPQPA